MDPVARQAKVAKCSRCGAELPADTPAGQCAPCLLQFGLTHISDFPAEEETSFQVSATAPAIPNYKILECLGEGGCGLVYRAEQREPFRREVAIKVVKPGMDTLAVLNRFEAERQALALMDHPHIARVLDAGMTQAGRPFFVMEFVRGSPITAYCDQKRLSVPERLKLFGKVCEAVQHAHQKGVIHRDLKPGNVLVTEASGVASPKVIDFGIAKAMGWQRLTDKTPYTAFERFLGTPAYMSPEQAELSGGDVDTRSDVYSLGALLYELLTGQPPFDQAKLSDTSFDELRRRIRLEDPPRLSVRVAALPPDAFLETARRRNVSPTGLVRLLRGELEWVVMKAMEKDRNLRYPSAHNLAVELTRRLTNQPISAVPPSTFYLVKKFFRRHRVFAGAIAAVLVSLVGGTTATLVELQHVRQAEDRERQLLIVAQDSEVAAMQEAADSKQIKFFMERMFDNTRLRIVQSRDAPLFLDQLDMAARQLHEELRGQPEVAAELLFVLANNYSWLREFERAETTYREAEQLIRHMKPSEMESHPDILEGLAEVLYRMGRNSEAETIAREALDWRQRSPQLPPGQISGSPAAGLLAALLRDHGVLEQARRLAQEQVEARRQWLGRTNDAVATALYLYASVLEQRGELAAAAAQYRSALDINLAMTNPAAATGFRHLGEVELQLDHLSAATELFQQAIDVDQRSVLNCHPEAIQALAGQARVAARRNSPGAAESLFARALTREGEGYTRCPLIVALTLGQSADFRRGTGDATGADTLALRAVTFLDHHHSEPTPAMIRLLGDSAESLLLRGDKAGALDRAEMAVSLARRGTKPFPPALAVAWDNKAGILHQLGRTAEAETCRREAEELLRRGMQASENGGEPSGWLIQALTGHANFLQAHGAADAAAEFHHSAVAFSRRLAYSTEPILRAFDDYALYLRSQGKAAEAEAIAAETQQRKQRGQTTSSK